MTSPGEAASAAPVEVPVQNSVSASPYAPFLERLPEPPPGLCAAFDTSKITHLGTRRARTSKMIVEGGAIYLATFDEATRKGELVAMPVGGTEARVLAAIAGIRAVDGIAVGEGIVYFSQDDVLRKVPASGGDVSVVAESFGGRISIYQSLVFGLRFDKAEKLDQVRRVATGGGTVVTVYERKREQVQELYYFAAVTGTTGSLFVADSGRRELLSVSFMDKQARVIKKGVAYPEGLVWVRQPAPPGLFDKSGAVGVALNEGSHLVVLHNSFDAKERANEAGFARFTTGYDSPIGSIEVRSFSEASWREIARVRSDVVDLAADADCVYISGGEAGQSVVSAIPRFVPGKKP